MENEIKGIGFDLFNTLIIADNLALKTAMTRLIDSLVKSGLEIDREEFRELYKESSIHFIKEADKTGIETHNRFWISDPLNKMGFSIEPNDPIINKGIEAYFSAFFDHCHLLPGTKEMLDKMSSRYTIGLVSNFTHAPAAIELLKHLDIIDYFSSIIISGDVGYRKPNPLIFRHFLDSINISPENLIFIGDDPLHDIKGAMDVGIRPIWMTYVRDNNLYSIPGYLRGEDSIVTDSVPRISSWKQLYKII